VTAMEMTLSRAFGFIAFQTFVREGSLQVFHRPHNQLNNVDLEDQEDAQE
jgi:hypothetical protein